jgi:hypothetical protein
MRMHQQVGVHRDHQPRKVIFLSASNGFTRVSKSSGTSMIVLICRCIVFEMLALKTEG